MSDDVKNEGREAEVTGGSSAPSAAAAEQAPAEAGPVAAGAGESAAAAGESAAASASAAGPVAAVPGESAAVEESAEAGPVAAGAGESAAGDEVAVETPAVADAAAVPAVELPAAASAPAPAGTLEEKLAEMSGEGTPPAEAKWYVVTTYSGFEHKAKQALEERIRKSPFPELFGQVLVPTEPPPEGKKKAAGRSFFPGYIFVEMVMNEQTWTLVKGTPRVTNFVGNQKPTPVPAEQIHEIQRQISEGAIKAKPEVVFSEGDRVRVSQGPFMNMNGTVSSINPVKQMVRVLVSIFGRATPVELEFHQVEKLP